MARSVIKWYGNKVERAVLMGMRKNVRDSVKVVKKTAKRIVAPVGYRSSGKADARRMVARNIKSKMFTAPRGWVYVNTKFARAWEMGGVVRSGAGKALAQPISASAKRAGTPRAFDDLIYVLRSGKPPLLVRKRLRGRYKTEAGPPEVMFVLHRSVIIPPHPYLRPGLANSIPEIKKLMGRQIDISGGGRR